MTKELFIRKRTGEMELFSFDKLEGSLRKSGASSDVIDKIIKRITPQLYDGISSKKIYKKAFSFLKKSNPASASKYGLKRALFKLGPTGYPFERLVSALLKQKGYKTQVGVVLPGACVTHEIDVLAEKDGNVYAIECKFHAKASFSSNVKTPLYINSRFMDIQTQWNNNPENKTVLKQGWLVTNTHFSLDAIKYAACIGLRLLSWDYPKGNGIAENIDNFGLYPITALTMLSKMEKEQIIEEDVVLIKELKATPVIMKKLGMPKHRIEQVLSEIDQLTIHHDISKR